MSEGLSSWSRRRAAVAAEAAAEEAAAQNALSEADHAKLAEKSDEEILEELGLPDPDALVQGDDFKAFMSKAVPQHLRKRALRTLWRSNPVLACLDGLNDYDDDYLTQGLNQGVIKTSYQVGKGMLAHLEEVQRLKDVVVAVVSGADPDETVPEVASEAEPDKEDEALTVASVSEDEGTVIHSPRRMQFQFQEDMV